MDFYFVHPDFYCTFAQNIILMGKKVFISHASKDKEIVSLFVDKILIAGYGLQQEDIFYTSREDTGIANGHSIPKEIKAMLSECSLYFLMISKNYRESEVCLNEMGAAWMVDETKLKTIILPNTDFDQIGWILKLNKASDSLNDEHLDAIRDMLIETFGQKNKTGTWNANKKAFLKEIDTLNPDMVDAISEEVVPEIDEELDILTIRERFDENMSAHNAAILKLTASLTGYTKKIQTGTKQLNTYIVNPSAFSTSQVRGIFARLAKETNEIADINEEQTPLLKNHFDLAVKYGLMLQGKDIDAETKEDNKNHFRTLLETIRTAREQLNSYKDTMDGFVDLDRSFTKAANRLKKTQEEQIKAFSFCITRGEEYLLS